MTIEIANLKKMLVLEARAAGWFEELSPKEKKAYIKAHPKSKYAKTGAAPVASKLGPTKARALHDLHSNISTQHAKAAGKAKTPELRAAHKRAMNLHQKAANAFATAAGHYDSGRKLSATNSLTRANGIVQKAKAHKKEYGINLPVPGAKKKAA